MWETKRRICFCMAYSEMSCRKDEAGSLVLRCRLTLDSAAVLSELDGRQTSKDRHWMMLYPVIKRTNCARISKAEMYF